MTRATLVVTFAVAAFPAIASEPHPAVAIEYAGHLKRLCNAEKKSGEYAMCWSFIGAVLEVVNNNSIYGFKVCVPPLVTVQRAVNLTVTWLHDHPDRDMQAASSVTTQALAAAFPCKN